MSTGDIFRCSRSNIERRQTDAAVLDGQRVRQTNIWTDTFIHQEKRQGNVRILTTF